MESALPSWQQCTLDLVTVQSRFSLGLLPVQPLCTMIPLELHRAYTCTCIHFKQAGLLQELARRHLRHSRSAATVSVACRCQTRYEKTEVRSDLRNHPRQASLVAGSTTNRLQVGSSGLQVPAQYDSSLHDGDGTTRVTHSRTAFASFICSRICYRAEDRVCLVGSSRFLERWTITLKQSSNWLESSFHFISFNNLLSLHKHKYNNKQWDLEIKSRVQEEGLKKDRVANKGHFNKLSIYQ